MYILVRGLYIANFTHTHHLSHTHTLTPHLIYYMYILMTALSAVYVQQIVVVLAVAWMMDDDSR